MTESSRVGSLEITKIVGGVTLIHDYMGLEAFIPWKDLPDLINELKRIATEQYLNEEVNLNARKDGCS